MSGDLRHTMEDKNKDDKAFDFWTTTLNGAKYIVAPMVDQSELAWRMLSRRHGAQLCYTPMFHASNFVNDPHYRREALLSCAEDRPLIIQFCANNPDILLAAAKLAEPHCDAIDLNLGCPQCIAKRGHYGAFLQDEWPLVTSLVKTCAENLSIPITCKIRVFESIEKTVKYAQCLQDAGCQLLTVHGRTREQKGMDTGLASWDHIKAVREKLQIPVFANGNIQYFDDIERCMKHTGVQGVMTAEGNLHNPALFTGSVPPCWQMTEEYLELVDRYPCPLSYVRGHLFKINHHALQVHTDIRQLVFTAKSIECFKLANIQLKERCLVDSEKEPSSDMMTEHGVPYWLCQPYIRPKPTEKSAPLVVDKAEKRESLKRPLEKIFTGIDVSSLSIKRMKRMLKYPHKNFGIKPPVQVEKCAICPNTKGGRCTFNLCKCCCRIKTFNEVLDCTGHNFLIKTKTEGRNAYENKLNELNHKNMDIKSQPDRTLDSGHINKNDSDTDCQREANVGEMSITSEHVRVDNSCEETLPSSNHTIETKCDATAS